MNFMTKILIVLVGISSGSLVAETPPKYLSDTLPEHATVKILEGWAAVQNERSQIDEKTRELIALAVSAQIPCDYCVHAHSTRLKASLGATDSELKEAIAIAGFIRLFSTVLNGNEYDINKFKGELNDIVQSKQATDREPGFRNLNNYFTSK